MNKTNKKNYKKKNKSIKRNKTVRKSVKKTMKGGYGVASYQPFENTPNQYTYPLNNYSSDPNNPIIMGSERLNNPILHKGGKKNKKTMKGGDFLLGSASNNVLSFGNFDGAKNAYNIVSGNVNDQPSNWGMINTKYYA